MVYLLVPGIDCNPCPGFFSFYFQHRDESYATLYSYGHFFFQFLYLAGLFSNHGPLYFVSTKMRFSKMGLACHIAKIHSEVHLVCSEVYFLGLHILY